MNKKKGKKVNNPILIKHPYELTANFIKWKFTPGENRILIRMLQRIKANQEIGIQPQININEQVSMKFHYRDLMLTNVNDTKKLKDNLQKLREKSFHIPYKKDSQGNVIRERLTGIINEVDYNHGDTNVTIFLNAKWYEFLTKLGAYTEYNSQIAYNLNTSYTIKMYYFISHWIKTTKSKSLTIEQFRKEFDIPSDKYVTKTATRFKERILEPCKKALDETADKTFTYDLVKHGRKIVAFSFTFIPLDRNNGDNIIDWKAVNLFFERINNDFPLDSVQRARISGLIKKYSFPIVKYFYIQQQAYIFDKVNSGASVVDAFSIGLNDFNIDPIEKENES